MCTPISEQPDLFSEADVAYLWLMCFQRQTCHAFYDFENSKLDSWQIFVCILVIMPKRIPGWMFHYSPAVLFPDSTGLLKKIHFATN